MSQVDKEEVARFRAYWKWADEQERLQRIKDYEDKKAGNKSLGATASRVLDLSSSLGIPTIAEERALVIRCEAGDRDAINELAVRNARLITMFMKRYRGVEADDLFQAGYLGLSRAAEKVTLQKWELAYSRMLASPPKYGKSSPRPFAYYAQFWIMAIMGRESIYQGTSVHIGKNLGAAKRKASEKTIELQRNARNAISLDAVNEERKGCGTEYGPTITRGIIGKVDRALSVPAFDIDDDIDINRILAIAEDVLEPREFAILMDYFGIGGEIGTLKEVGEKYGLCRERIRQLNNESLDTIRKTLKRREVLV